MKGTGGRWRTKTLLVAAAVAIAAASLVVSHRLTRGMEAAEEGKMEIWAEAMRSLRSADETTDLALVLKVLDENHTIPVVVTDRRGRVQTYRNLTLHAETAADSTRQASQQATRMRRAGQYIRIALDTDGTTGDYVDVCYGESSLLRLLAIWPLVWLTVVAVFVAVAAIALLSAKRAEQDRVWVGLSKETAHQLGTPISSLMAWAEMLRESHPDDPLLPEMEKDIERLTLIADRFSRIGSTPTLQPTALQPVIRAAADYMQRRVSRRVEIRREMPEEDITVSLNTSLFQWVIENLCKNAVDAMEGGAGTITLRLSHSHGRAIIDVEDTGKGIRRKDMRDVFRPGYTTKRRGWGLGLSLARRIIEDYHRGRIYVAASEMGQGTTFRIELRADK